MLFQDLLALDKAGTNPILKLVNNFTPVNNAFFQLRGNTESLKDVDRLKEKLKAVQELVKKLKKEAFYKKTELDEDDFLKVNEILQQLLETDPAILEALFCQAWGERKISKSVYKLAEDFTSEFLHYETVYEPVYQTVDKAQQQTNLDHAWANNLSIPQTKENGEEIADITKEKGSAVESKPTKGRTEKEKQDLEGPHTPSNQDKFKKDIGSLKKINELINEIINPNTTPLERDDFLLNLSTIGQRINDISWDENDKYCIRNEHGYRNRYKKKSNSHNPKGAKLDFETLCHLQDLAKDVDSRELLITNRTLVENSLTVLQEKVHFILSQHLERSQCVELGIPPTELKESHNTDVGFIKKVTAYYHDKRSINKLITLLETIDTPIYQNLDLSNKVDRYWLGYFFVQLGETAKEISEFIKPETNKSDAKENTVRFLFGKLGHYRQNVKGHPEIIYQDQNEKLPQVKAKLEQDKTELKAFLEQIQTALNAIAVTEYAYQTLFSQDQMPIIENEEDFKQEIDSLTVKLDLKEVFRGKTIRELARRKQKEIEDCEKIITELQGKLKQAEEEQQTTSKTSLLHEKIKNKTEETEKKKAEKDELSKKVQEIEKGSQNKAIAILRKIEYEIENLTIIEKSSDVTKVDYARKMAMGFIRQYFKELFQGEEHSETIGEITKQDFLFLDSIDTAINIGHKTVHEMFSSYVDLDQKLKDTITSDILPWQENFFALIPLLYEKLGAREEITKLLPQELIALYSEDEKHLATQSILIGANMRLQNYFKVEEYFVKTKTLIDAIMQTPSSGSKLAVGMYIDYYSCLKVCGRVEDAKVVAQECLNLIKGKEEYKEIQSVLTTSLLLIAPELHEEVDIFTCSPSQLLLVADAYLEYNNVKKSGDILNYLGKQIKAGNIQADWDIAYDFNHVNAKYCRVLAALSLPDFYRGLKPNSDGTVVLDFTKIGECIEKELVHLTLCEKALGQNADSFKAKFGTLYNNKLFLIKAAKAWNQCHLADIIKNVPNSIKPFVEQLNLSEYFNKTIEFTKEALDIYTHCNQEKDQETLAGVRLCRGIARYHLDGNYSDNAIGNFAAAKAVFDNAPQLWKSAKSAETISVLASMFQKVGDNVNHDICHQKLVENPYHKLSLGGEQSSMFDNTDHI